MIMAVKTERTSGLVHIERSTAITCSSVIDHRSYANILISPYQQGHIISMSCPQSIWVCNNAWMLDRFSGYSRHKQSVFLCFWGSAFQDVVCRICPIRLQWTGGHLGAIPMMGPIGPSKHILLRSEPRINDFLWSPGLSEAVAVPTGFSRRCYEFVVKLCWRCLFKSLPCSSFWNTREVHSILYTHWFIEGCNLSDLEGSNLWVPQPQICWFGGATWEWTMPKAGSSWSMSIVP